MLRSRYVLVEGGMDVEMVLPARSAMLLIGESFFTTIHTANAARRRLYPKYQLVPDMQRLARSQRLAPSVWGSAHSDRRPRLRRIITEQEHS
jgi:hypothetical protein